jgi:adenosylcobinamide-GDP ribazoletransferase
MKKLLLAVGFLTSFPVRLKEAPAPGDLGRAAIWFPFIGVAIGLTSALVYWAGTRVVSIALAAVLATAAWVALTGGLHLDGLADCFDGMLNASSAERRLEIMKDPRLGTFGGIGLFLSLAIKTAGIYSLSPASAWIALPLAALVGRWLLLWAGKQPLARPGGLGADFAAGLDIRILGLAALPVIPFVVLGGWPAVAGAGAACAAAWGIFRLARARLGGITGDVMGLTTEIAELVVLVVYSAF